MLRLTNISKSYNSSEEVLKNINLDFKSNGLVTILGTSGSGKSTLLNIIGLLDEPTTGNIIYKNVDINNTNKKNQRSYQFNEIGFIYQNYNLIDYLTVKDNIELINKSKNLDKLLEKLDIKKLKHKKVSLLSGGEKQRVAIARALINDPSILLCDEPTGALDSKNSVKIMELLKEISKTKLVIMVTHNESLASLYSNRIITLKDGCILKDSSNEINECYDVFKSKKINVKKSRIINIIKNNLLNKLKRNIMTLIAISIGLSALLLVLGLSSGFKSALDKEEKDSLSKYPITISKTSTNLESELSEAFNSTNKDEKEKVYSVETVHKNKITKKYVNNLKVINSEINYMINTYIIDNKVITTSNNDLKDIKIIKGSYPNKDNEVLLLLDENNQINNEYLISIGKNKKEYDYESLINYEYKIKKKTYKITAIGYIENNNYLKGLTGLIYKENNFKNLIPDSINLYPKSYKSKLKILNHLNKYKNIYYTDLSTSIKSISITLMNSISIVLICFSILSLLVSTILISILSFINVIERIKQIGLYKSFGLSNRIIKSIFYIENIIISLMSSLVSLIFVYLISIPINNLLYKYTGLENILVIKMNTYILVLILSIILTLIASIIPINKTKKYKAIDCLRSEY